MHDSLNALDPLPKLGAKVENNTVTEAQEEAACRELQLMAFELLPHNLLGQPMFLSQPIKIVDFEFRLLDI